MYGPLSLYEITGGTTGQKDTREFADRCRALSQKVVCKVNDPIAQQIHHENG
jgi:hypothetical protein